MVVDWVDHEFQGVQFGDNWCVTRMKGNNPPRKLAGISLAAADETPRGSCPTLFATKRPSI